jgi:hypothetical protein
LENVLRATAHGETPLERLRAMASAVRRFGTTEPGLYDFVFSHGGDAAAVVAARAAAVAPLFEVLRPLVNDSDLLHAARTLTAFLHGHITMSNAGAFELGGSVDAAFDYGLETIVRGFGVRPRD